MPSEYDTARGAGPAASSTPAVLTLARAPGVQRRALRVAILVGTLLTLINQGPDWRQGEVVALWQVALTYLVPWAVSTWTSVALQREQARRP